jgi:hypothetical protein
VLATAGVPRSAAAGSVQGLGNLDRRGIAAAGCPAAAARIRHLESTSMVHLSEALSDLLSGVVLCPQDTVVCRGKSSRGAPDRHRAPYVGVNWGLLNPLPPSVVLLSGGRPYATCELASFVCDSLGCR